MSWSGIKKQSIKVEIEAWCEEMGIKRYTINSQGEIDVDDNVIFRGSNIKELPYKFGTVMGQFNLSNCKNLISIKNCPNLIDGSFDCSDCPKLDSLEGCPKEVKNNFWCDCCKIIFTEEEIKLVCDVRGKIYNKMISTYTF